MNRVLIALVPMLAIAQDNLSKTPASFDVAAIRMTPADQGVWTPARESIEANPGNVVMRSVNIRSVIMWAYNLKIYQVSGNYSPDPLNIQAKAAEGTPIDEMKLMMRELLTQRFGLGFHWDSRRMGMQTLIVDKQGIGPGLRTAGDGLGTTEAKATRLRLRRTMPSFADLLTMMIAEPVLDQTGLPGTYDISIDVGEFQSPGADRDEQRYAFLAAMKQQLGLDLRREQLDVKVMVVDRSTKPSAN